MPEAGGAFLEGRLCSTLLVPGTSSPNRLSTGRTAVFAVVAALAVLLGLNGVVEQLEHWRLVTTTHPADRVQYVEERLWARGRDGRWHTTAYAEESLVRQSFPVDKRGGYRVGVVGGSFAMGSPYVLQGYPNTAGGIPFFLERGLTQGRGGRSVEVINASAGGQNSSRARSVAEQLLQLDLDLLVVLTCNNEGQLRPRQMQAWLNEQGGYRLLKRWLSPEPSSAWFTPQHPDLNRLRHDYRQNLRAMVQDATERGVSVALGTLPVNLRYRGWDTGGHILRGEQPPRPAAAVPAREPMRIAPGFETHPVCTTGVLLFEANEFGLALPMLRACLRAPDPPDRLTERLPAYAAIAEYELGIADDVTRLSIEATLGECLAGGIDLYYAGRYEEAMAVFERCDDPAEALRWHGFSLLAQGAAGPARQALQQTIELAPRNRCRPTFNDIIREEAAAAEGAFLVDLDALSQAAAPLGLPGPEVFVDYCHMNWRGYASMARQLGAAIERETGVPFRLDDANVPAAAAGLPFGDNAEQIRVTNEWTSGDRQALRPIP